MIKKVIAPNAPAAIGPYSHAIVVPANSHLVFVSGQLPIDPKTGELLQGDIRELTHLTLNNIEAILLESSSSLQHIIRAEIFLTDLKRDFAAVNEEYAKRINAKTPPARQTIQVAALPKGASIEISCIAYATTT